MLQEQKERTKNFYLLLSLQKLKQDHLNTKLEHIKDF